MKIGEFQSSLNYSQAYRDLYRDNYVVMQYYFVQFLTEHLGDVSRALDRRAIGSSSRNRRADGVAGAHPR